MSTNTPCQAIEEAKILSLYYDGYNRNVEVHAVGYSTQRNPVMRVWQVSGGSQSGNTTGWKLMRLDKASSMALSDDPSDAPREGYKKGDSAMVEIVCEV